MSSYTTADLLTSIRNRGNIPATSNSTNINSDTNILGIATEELHIKLLPMIMKAREEFYVVKKEYSITASQAEYAIPTRATGMILRDVQIINGSEIRSLTVLDSEYITTTSSGEPQGYYLEHNNVVLYPTPSATTGTLRIRYFLRPSRLIVTSSCAQISAIDTGTSTVTVSSIPSSWASGTEIDFVKKTTPHANPALDQTISSVSGTDITFSSLPTDLAVGDWIAPAGYTPIPQVPFEFQPLLAQLSLVTLLQAQGDREGAKDAWKDLQTMQENAITLISPRNQGERRKVIQRNWGHGFCKY